MFESICIRNQKNSENPIDIGFLAEAMLFYQQVRVIGNHLVLKQLVKQCGSETLIELLKGGFLKISYQVNNAGINTVNTNSPNEVHCPILFSMPSLALQNIAPSIFIEATGRSGKGRRLGNRFASMVECVSFPETMTKIIEEDFNAKNYIKKAVVQLLRIQAPEYQVPNPFEFEILKNEKGFAVRTNINFQLVNQSYHKHIPVSHSSISAAYILSQLFAVRENLHFSSQYSTELAVNHIDSSLLQTKIDDIFHQRNASGEQISNFQDFILEDGHAIRESINAGEKSFEDLLKLLDKAAKFKGWLKNQKSDENLCKNYLREVSASTWIEKLPAKSIRWTLFTSAGLVIDSIGAGGVGTAIGVGLSAADAFLLDKIINGWKPNHFVNGHLTNFLK